ncbi:MAG: MFS transporter [Peptococcaceae bacterium]|nr:MFS transporter [Peptococcaceae bacterium]
MSNGSMARNRNGESGAWSDLSSATKNTIFAAMGGWLFDAFDYMLIIMLLVPIMKGLHLTLLQISMVLALQIAASAAGGLIMGTVADYIGRKTAININILIYSISAGLMFFVHSLGFLIVLRMIAGLGLGGQWGNSMTLIAESVPDNYRGRAVAIGNVSWPIGTLLAAVFAFVIYPHVGWRVTFAIAAFPALFVFYILKFVPESAMWKEKRAEIINSRKTHVPYLTIFNKTYIKTTLVIVVTMMFTMFSYWMFWTWLPTYLIKEQGFNLSKTSTWLIVSQIGAFCGGCGSPGVSLKLEGITGRV